jgi:uncharacterized membrane protein HdeD (DUF308 family)
VCLGLFSVLAPGFALFGFAVVFAAYSLADGVASLVAGLRAARDGGARWGGLVIAGLAGIAVGVLFVLFPLRSTVAYAALVVWLVAAWAAATGVFEVVAAIRLRAEIEGEWLLAASGLLSVALAVALVWLLFANPAATLLSVAWLLALYAFLAGVALIVLALRMRRRNAAA